MKKITAKWLEKYGACDKGIYEFRQLFGEEADVNVENVMIAKEWIAPYFWWFIDDLEFDYCLPMEEWAEIEREIIKENLGYNGRCEIRDEISAVIDCAILESL